MRNCDACGGSIKYVNGHIARCEYCGRIFSVDGDALKEANTDAFYREAIGLLKKNDEQSISNAVDIFEALGSYKDSAERAYEGKNKISTAKAVEADKILEEKRNQELAEIEKKKAELKQKENRKILMIAAAVIAIVIVGIITILGISSSKKNAQYERALSYYQQHDYETAIAEFEKIDGYKDSQAKIAEIQTLIAEEERLAAERENTYNKAVKYYEEGLYQEAISSFNTISEYLDSSDYMEKSYAELYAEAEGNYNSEQYQECIDLLSIIPESSDYYARALALKKEADAILTAVQNAQTYDSAVAAYNSQDYEKAQKLFVEISGYEDADTYLDIIGEYYYSLANSSLTAGDYDACGYYCDYIDTLSEWGQYQRTVDLINTAKNQLIDLLVVQGKDICRRQGYNEMVNYINNSSCSLLAQSDLTDLKDKCTVRSFSLSELSPYAHDDKELTETTGGEDNLGNRYNYMLSSSYGKSANGFAHKGLYIASNYYLISGKYQYLTGTVGYKDYWDWDGPVTGYIEIYGDGRLLYSNTNITDQTLPYDISVDIAGVEKMSIRMGHYSTYSMMEVFLGDPMLTD